MISIVFDSPPGPESQFVEVERDGKSIRFGEWKQRAPYWCLDLVEVDHLEKQLAEAQQYKEFADEEINMVAEHYGICDLVPNMKAMVKDNAALRAQLAEANRWKDKYLASQIKLREGMSSERHSRLEDQLAEAQAELEEVKRKAWKTVDLEEGNMLVFVGVHVVAWQQEWGQPKVGFTRWNDDND